MVEFNFHSSSALMLLYTVINIYNIVQKDESRTLYDKTVGTFPKSPIRIQTS